MDEMETLKIHLDVAEEKLETSRAQAEERYYYYLTRRLQITCNKFSVDILQIFINQALT